MPYAFHPKDDDLQAALRRIAQEELGAAAARLAAPDATAIHDCRKNLKKTRALLRLVRTGLAVQPQENAALRAIATALSGPRDATVRLTTFTRLTKGDLPKALVPLHDHLKAEASGAPAAVPPGLQDSLMQIHDRAAHWKLRGKDARILAEGLATTRRAALRDQRIARDPVPHPEAFHDWRKRAKDHWYQARLFTPCWPEMFGLLAGQADVLCEALGDHHDLDALEAYVAALPAPICTPEALALLRPRLQSARTALEAIAHPLSSRLHAGEPDEIARLWVTWYRIWRR